MMGSTEVVNAVQMVQGHKTYWESITKQQTVLKEMDLTVPQGTIYGLLGPSGCGKTTLLKCILGRLSLDSGEVEVFGYVPGTVASGVPGKDVGYMPQELALFEELSIQETWTYFGGICGMKSSKIKKRSLFMQDFLNLPPLGKLTKNLSGGQKRRVSFACALLHEPKLLILDEPTVGVDPMLRKSIWEHLTALLRQNVTVMITTHYIEESRTCDRVGFMMNGKLLAEDNPEVIIAQNNCLTLEEVFLKLCIRDSSQNVPVEPILSPEQLKKRLGKQSIIRFEDESLLDGAVVTVGGVPNGDNIQSKPEVVNIEMPPRTRRSSLMGFPRRASFGMPKRFRTSVDLSSHQRLGAMSTYTTFFKSLSAKDKFGNWFRMPKYYRLRAIFQKAMIRSYRAKGASLFQFVLPAVIMLLVCFAIGRPISEIKIAIVNKDTEDYGAQFLSYVDDHVIVKKPYDSCEEAFKDARDGLNWGVLRIGENFTESLVTRLMHGALADENKVLESNINISLDLTNPFIALTVTKELFTSLEAFLGAVVKRQGFSENIVQFPIVYTDNVYGSLDENLTDFIIPGITIFIVFFISMGCTGLSFALQKDGGLLDRSYVGGVTAMEVILGELFANSWTVAAQTFSTMIIALGVFQIKCVGSLFLVVSLIFFQGMCGIVCGIFIASLFDQELTITMGGLSVLFPSLILTGAVWPIEGMHPIMGAVAKCFPQTYAVEALRSVMFRGWSLLYFPVYMGFAITFVWFSLFLFLSSIVFQMKD